MSIFRQLVFSALAMLLLAGACKVGSLTVSRPIEPGPFTWQLLALKLPASIRVYEGEATGPKREPFRAWYASIDYSDTRLKAQPFLAEDPSGRELPSVQARQARAFVAIDGGYFDMESKPAKTYSLVVQNGNVLRENRSLMGRGGRRYFAARSAFGIAHNRKFEIGWVFHHAGRIWKLDQPAYTLLRKGQVAPDFSMPEYLNRREWTNLESAVGGGPRLVQNGRIRVTFEEEIFFGSGFQNEASYARAAVGWTRDNRLIFCVVDGRQPTHSVGVTLRQFAQMLVSLGCVEAMNLDGGGSAAIVANGVLLNKPSDGSERATTSILAVVANS